VDRGEMPNEPGDSWFSPKCIEVQPQVFVNGGRALDGLGGESLPTPTKLQIPLTESLGVRLRGISSVVERETAQTIS
jgi:hypothetical protein